MRAFKKLPDQSIDAVITDPPYFLDQLKTDWDENMLDNITKSSQVSSLPGRMKFDRSNNVSFCYINRIVTPGELNGKTSYEAFSSLLINVQS